VIAGVVSVFGGLFAVRALSRPASLASGLGRASNELLSLKACDSLRANAVAPGVFDGPAHGEVAELARRSRSTDRSVTRTPLHSRIPLASKVRQSGPSDDNAQLDRRR
jgi:hypothetical protein